MSYDIALLDENDSLLDRVSLGVDAHFRLMSRAAPESGFELLNRMRDYYTETEIYPQEFKRLKTELEALRVRVSSDEELDRILTDLNRLIDVATTLDRPLAVLPD